MSLLVHRVRCVPLPVAPPCAIAISPNGLHMALLRDDATLELWNRDTDSNNAFALEMRTCLFDDVAASSAGASSVAFLTNTHLVVGSLSGQLLQCDLSGRLLAQVDSYGGAVWAIAANPKLAADGSSSAVLAVACEDGCVRLFKQSHNNSGESSATVNSPLVLFKTLAKQKARITALAWHCRGEILVSGDAGGGVCVWAPAKSVNPKVHFDVARRGAEVAIVWAVAMLRDTTVVTGDSHGHTTMWNARFGTPIYRAAEHAADVLAVAVSNDDRFVFAAGVDAKVVMFQRTADSGTGAAAGAAAAAAAGNPDQPTSWTVAGAERRHTHDIRALAVTGGTKRSELLLSVSLDCTVNVFNVAGLPRKATPYQLTPTRADQRVSLAPEARAVVAHHGNSVSLWALGDAAASTGDALAGERTGAQVSLGQSIRCLASVRLRSDAPVLCSAASSNLSMLAVSTRDSTKLFGVDQFAAGTAARVRRVRDISLPGAVHMCFTGARLVLATRDGEILTCSAADGSNASVAVAATTNDEGVTVRILALAAASFDDSLIAYALSDNSVRLVRLHDDARATVVELPRTPAHCVAVSFDAHSHHLVVCCADSRFLVWDCDANTLTPWSRQYGDKLPAKLTKKRELLRGAMFNPQQRGANEMAPSMYLWSDAWLMPIDLTKEPPAKVEEVDKTREAPGFRQNFWLVNKFQPVVHAGFVAPHELVVVELPAATTLSQLPKTLFRARYGI